MPRILEGRRRGFGGGTRGILADGDQFYQRRESDDSKLAPQKQAPPTSEAQAPDPDSPSWTAPEAHTSPQQPQESDDNMISIEEARKRWLRKSRRKKKRSSLLSAGGILEDESFSFGSNSKKKATRQQQPQESSLSPLLSNGSSNHPMVTPAASVASYFDHGVPTTEVTTTTSVDKLGDKDGATRESPLSWQSPRHNSLSLEEGHKQELEALKESNRLEIEELTRKHKQELEAQKLKFQAEAQKWKEKCEEKDTKMKELTEQYTANEKAKDQQYSKLLQETVSKLEEKHLISSKAQDEEHAKAIQEAITAERARVQRHSDEEKKELGLLKKELVSCKTSLQELELRSMAKQQVEMQKSTTRLLALSRAQREGNEELHRNQIASEAENEIQKAEVLAPEGQKTNAEGSNRNPPVLEEASAFFSKGSSADFSPFMQRFSLVNRFAFSCSRNLASKTEGRFSKSPLPVHQFSLSDDVALPSGAESKAAGTPMQNVPQNDENPFRASDRKLAMVTRAAANRGNADSRGSSVESLSNAGDNSKPGSKRGDINAKKQGISAGKEVLRFKRTSTRRSVRNQKSLHEVIPSFKLAGNIQIEEKKRSKQSRKRSTGETGTRKRRRNIL